MADLKYLTRLAKEYPNQKAAKAELINLRAILPADFIVPTGLASAISRSLSDLGPVFAASPFLEDS